MPPSPTSDVRTLLFRAPAIFIWFAFTYRVLDAYQGLGCVAGQETGMQCKVGHLCYACPDGAGHLCRNDILESCESPGAAVCVPKLDFIVSLAGSALATMACTYGVMWLCAAVVQQEVGDTSHPRQAEFNTPPGHAPGHAPAQPNNRARWTGWMALAMLGLAALNLPLLLKNQSAFLTLPVADPAFHTAAVCSWTVVALVYCYEWACRTWWGGLNPGAVGQPAAP